MAEAKDATPDWMSQLKKKKRGKSPGRKAGGTARSKSPRARRTKKDVQGTGESFTEQLDEKSLEFFNEVCHRTFAQQAQFFLDAFWEEHGDQADIIYTHLWPLIKKVDMEHLGIHWIHEYEEGVDLDFDMALRLFESVYDYFTKGEGEDFADECKQVIPELKTSIARKKELRNKVDVNFDGRIGMLEFLLYTYHASPKTLMERSMHAGEIDPELKAAQEALEAVNADIRKVEKEKARLQKIADGGSGVKALGAKNMLAQMDSSPLMDHLRKSLITAEAKIRIVNKKLKKQGKSTSLAPPSEGGEVTYGAPSSSGTVWWMNRELEEKKKIYGPRFGGGGGRRSVRKKAGKFGK